MKLTFRGVRGSIASPGSDTVIYGGNTTCIEVRTDDNQLLILDAGTGIFPLSRTLLPELPLHIHLFITHTHWDHIQGLPFFIPLFMKGNQITIYGAFDPVGQRNIREVLARQMEYAFFPVSESQLNATIRYQTVTDHQAVQVQDATITPLLMNHPVMNFGYRINCGNKSMFFSGDHEWDYNIYDPDDAEYGEYQQMIQDKHRSILDFIQDVDVLVMDSSYTREEYPHKRGWGHGTFDTSIQTARQAQARHLFCTHHEPTRTDADLERVFREALDRYPRQPNDPEYHLARENISFQF